MLQQYLLLKRLDQLAQALTSNPHALALIGQGSSGPEQERLDGYSDLDVFVVVREGQKHRFLSNLDWLEPVCPIAYAFQRTRDEYKVLFDDGIFCEVGVFHLAELTTEAFIHGDWSAAGKVLWHAPDFDVSTLPAPHQPPSPPTRTVEWMVGEILTNLYVGLGRYHRGEKLSAFRFIQGYAVDRIMELTPLLEPEQAISFDPYQMERRYERRFPQTAQVLPNFMQGYSRTIESAQAILAFLEQHFIVNSVIKQCIEALCKR